MNIALFYDIIYLILGGIILFKFIKFSFALLVFFSISNSFSYDRKEWKHWIGKEGCKNTRAYLLEKESLEPVKFTNRKDGKNCTVLSGKWNDFYYNETLTLANDIDVDHVVPLKHAHDSGGSNWGKKKKEEFANDELNLVLTNKKYNRQKGAKTPLEWMPINREYACKYMKRWIAVKEKYKLLISQKEHEHFKLLKCQ